MPKDQPVLIPASSHLRPARSAGALAVAWFASACLAADAQGIEPLNLSPTLDLAAERLGPDPTDAVLPQAADDASLRPFDFDPALVPRPTVLGRAARAGDAGFGQIVAAPTRREPGAFRFDFGRDTDLIDGGIGGAPTLDETGVSHFESGGERFDRYSLNLEWNPAGPDAPLQWLVIGGVHAIKADISRLDEAELGLTEADGVVAIPTVGTGFRWAPSEFVSFSTIASTQTIENDANLLDFTAATEFRLSPSVGLTAGYELYRSDVEVEDIRTSLDREGLFARLTISF